MSQEKELDKRLAKANPVPDALAPEIDLDLNRITSSGDNHLGAKISRKRVFRPQFLIAAAVVVAGLAIGSAFPQSSEPLFSLASGGSSKALSMNGEQASDARMIMPMVNYEYIPGDDLPNFDYEGKIFQIRANQDLASFSEELAYFFGVSNPQLNNTDPNYVFYQSGNYEDGKPYLNVSKSGSVIYFDYSDPASYLQPDCLKSDEYGCVEFREIKADKSKLPSESEAAEYIHALARLQGLNESDYRVSTTIDDWGMRAVLTMLADGQAIPIETSVQWNQQGRLAYVYAVVGQLIEVKQIKTVTSTVAANRANDFRWYGNAHYSLMNYPAFPAQYSARDLAADGVTESPESTKGTVGEPGLGVATEPGFGATTEPAPDMVTDPGEGSDPATDQRIETQRIALKSAKSATLLVYSNNSEMWLVPGFIFESEQGSIPVIATPDGLIDLPEPIMPMVR